MFRMNRILEEMVQDNRRIGIGLVGVGKMGRSLLIQLSKIKGIEPVIVIDHTPNKAKKALEACGYEQVLITNDQDEADRHIQFGGIVVTEDYELLYDTKEVDAVVEATGIPAAGAEIALRSIEAKKHIIMMNVECDSAVGPILYQKAQEAGVVYTGTKGDEPGALIELVTFAKSIGLDIMCVGKGKNNKLDLEATHESLREEAQSKGLSPHMLCSFVDGTNTMTEMTSFCNATGFLPDVPGCHGITTSPQTIVQDLKLKRDGGILSKPGVVEYAFGMAPGVFALVTSEDEEIQSLMTYLGQGRGPSYLLYRPFHLTSVETPISIFEAVIDREASIAPVMGQVADAAVVAKRNLKAGESLKGIGKDTILAKIVDHRELKEKDYLPIALVSDASIIKRDVKKGSFIRMSDVQLDEELTIVKLRREQDREEDNKASLDSR